MSFGYGTSASVFEFKNTAGIAVSNTLFIAEGGLGFFHLQSILVPAEVEGRRFDLTLIVGVLLLARDAVQRHFENDGSAHRDLPPRLLGFFAVRAFARFVLGFGTRTTRSREMRSSAMRHAPSSNA